MLQTLIAAFERAIAPTCLACDELLHTCLADVHQSSEVKR